MNERTKDNMTTENSALKCGIASMTLTSIFCINLLHMYAFNDTYV